VPETPTYLLRRPRLAHVHMAGAVWPPQSTRRALICILATEPNGGGYPGRRLTKSTELAPTPTTSQRSSEAVIGRSIQPVVTTTRYHGGLFLRALRILRGGALNSAARPMYTRVPMRVRFERV